MLQWFVRLWHWHDLHIEYEAVLRPDEVKRLMALVSDQSRVSGCAPAVAPRGAALHGGRGSLLR
jgi:hypothetical protein